jgi:AraC family transcriptional activator of mtrCDE
MQEVGMGTMTSLLLKQVLIMLLRQSLKSPALLSDVLPVLSDPRIARAVAAMLSEPATAHTVELLAQKSGLSRSGFMARFSEVVGDTPMAVLRRLRLRKAAELLKLKAMSVEQVANFAGYRSRNGFSRAFRRAYGFHPAEYRAAAMTPRDREGAKAYRGKCSTCVSAVRPK